MIRVAFEATPLLGQKTGVGEFCSGALSGLSRQEGLTIKPFAVTWRNRHRLDEVIGDLSPMRQLPMPARPLQGLWSKVDFPPLEFFVGKFDVVHGSNFVVPPTMRAKRVVTVHDLTPLLFPHAADPSTLVFPKLIQRAMNGGAFVHTPSEYIAMQVREHFNVRPERVHAVYHGGPEWRDITERPIWNLQSEFQLKTAVGNDPFLLGLGTIEPRKDFVTLVRAFEEVASEYADLKLVIAGQPGWGANELDEVVRKSIVSDRIIRPGYVSRDIRRWLLENASVFVYSSLYEGFGLPPIEAMQLGTPVIATKAGSLPEVLANAAILNDIGDSVGIANSIRNLLADDFLRSGLIELGYERASFFSWENCASGLFSIYKLALES